MSKSEEKDERLSAKIRNGKRAHNRAKLKKESKSLLAEAEGYLDAAEVLSIKYMYMVNKYNWPVFEPAEDSALIAEWLKACNTGEQMHAFMDEEFNQGFMMGRILSLMEDQLEFDDSEETPDNEAE